MPFPTNRNNVFMAKIHRLVVIIVYVLNYLQDSVGWIEWSLKIILKITFFFHVHMCQQSKNKVVVHFLFWILCKWFLIFLKTKSIQLKMVSLSSLSNPKHMGDTPTPFATQEHMGDILTPSARLQPTLRLVKPSTLMKLLIII